MISLFLVTHLLFAVDINYRPVPQKEMEKVLKLAEAQRPAENTGPIKTVDLPLYPILQHKDKTYISVFKVSHRLSKKWEESLRVRFDSLKKDESAFYIEGSSAQDFLKEMGFSLQHKIFYRTFEKQNVETVALSKVERLLVVVNGAAGGNLGVVGVEIKSESKPEAHGALGLAWVGTESPFTLQKTKFLKRDKAVPRFKTVAELQNFITANWEPKDPIQFESAEEARLELGDWALIEILYSFRATKQSQDQLMGYFLKKSDQVIAFKNLQFTDERSSSAEKILGGDLLKEYKQVLVFSSMGESDCGMILLLKKDGTWVQNQIHCGSWGC